jgi:hypothetical protein
MSFIIYIDDLSVVFEGVVVDDVLVVAPLAPFVAVFGAPAPIK